MKQKTTKTAKKAAKSDIPYSRTRFWSFKNPTGQTHQFWNLRTFVREHKDLFDKEDVKFRPLSQSMVQPGKKPKDWQMSCPAIARLTLLAPTKAKKGEPELSLKKAWAGAKAFAWKGWEWYCANPKEEAVRIKEWDSRPVLGKRRERMNTPVMKVAKKARANRNTPEFKASQRSYHEKGKEKQEPVPKAPEIPVQDERKVVVSVFPGDRKWILDPILLKCREVIIAEVHVHIMRANTPAGMNVTASYQFEATDTMGNLPNSNIVSGLFDSRDAVLASL